MPHLAVRALAHLGVICALRASTADEIENDPTVTRCIGYARTWGYGGLCMANLFASRDTDPRGMKAAPDPVGPKNDERLSQQAGKAGVVVAAWGTHGVHQGRDRVVRARLGGVLHYLETHEVWPSAAPAVSPRRPKADPLGGLTLAGLETTHCPSTVAAKEHWLPTTVAPCKHGTSTNFVRVVARKVAVAATLAHANHQLRRRRAKVGHRLQHHNKLRRNAGEHTASDRKAH